MNSSAIRTDYPCGEALDDLEIFIKAHIKDHVMRQELVAHLDECRNIGRLGFRYIHEEIMKYRKDFSDYFVFTEDERKMIDDLFYFWG